MSVDSFLRFPKKRRKIWTAIRSLLTGLPPIFLAYFSYTYQPEDNEAKISGLKPFWEDHTLLAVTLLLSPIAITFVGEIYEYFGDVYSDKNSLSDAESATILSSIDEIVGAKAKRFSDVYASIRNSDLDTPKEIFSKLTQPDEQIRLLITHFHLTFREFTQDHGLKTVLCSFKEGCPFRFDVYMPSGSKPPSILLGENGRKTFFAHVFRTEKAIAIPDISKHLKLPQSKRLYWAGGPDSEGKNSSVPEEDLVGSIVGFPIRSTHMDKVLYVLTLKSEVPKKFDSAFVKKYKSHVKRFEERLCLEDTLKEIRTLVLQRLK